MFFQKGSRHSVITQSHFIPHCGLGPLTMSQHDDDDDDEHFMYHLSIGGAQWPVMNDTFILKFKIRRENKHRRETTQITIMNKPCSPPII